MYHLPLSPNALQQAESDAEMFFPPTPWVACKNAAPTRLYIGGFAYVSNDPPLANQVRSDAGKNFAVIGKIEPGEMMEILEWPKCANNWVWWKVFAPAIELTGWTAEGDSNAYWLMPCPIDSECAPYH